MITSKYFYFFFHDDFLFYDSEHVFSTRFYEALLSKCVPIVNSVRETFRSEAESRLDYRFYLACEEPYSPRPDWARYNYDLFLKYHTLKYAKKARASMVTQRGDG